MKREGGMPAPGLEANCEDGLQTHLAFHVKTTPLRQMAYSRSIVYKYVFKQLLPRTGETPMSLRRLSPSGSSPLDD